MSVHHYWKSRLQNLCATVRSRPWLWTTRRLRCKWRRPWSPPAAAIGSTSLSNRISFRCSEITKYQLYPFAFSFKKPTFFILIIIWLPFFLALWSRFRHSPPHERKIITHSCLLCVGILRFHPLKTFLKNQMFSILLSIKVVQNVPSETLNSCLKFPLGHPVSLVYFYTSWCFFPFFVNPPPLNKKK